MMRKLLYFGLMWCVSLSVGFAQIINPGGGVSSIYDVPGLTNALGQAVTNVYKGADTGTPTGAVVRAGQQVDIQFPTIPASLTIFTNTIHGSVTIDPSGVTVINYYHVFANVPFITLTPEGTNITQLLTPLLISVSVSGATFSVISSGSLVTNAYQVDWQANDGSGLSIAGPSFAAFGGTTNIYLNNGAQPMNSFYFPVGSGAGKWLISDAGGHGSWQDRTVANLNDGFNVFKADGTVLPTADFDMNGKRILNATRIQLSDGAGAGRYLMSDASGLGLWSTLSSWSPAASSLNMNGFDLTAVGVFTETGDAVFNGTAYHNGITHFNAAVTLDTTSINGPLLTTSFVNLTQSGGSWGNPNLYVKGYARFDGVVDLRGTVQANSLLTANNGILAYANPVSPGTVALLTVGGTHVASEGDIIAGDAGYLATTIPLLGAPWGNLIAERGIFGATLNITGAKSFRIQHPMDPHKYLSHASVESPKVELLYRGRVPLAAGTASVNLNTYYGLIPNTLDGMVTNLTVNVYNNAGWTQVRCASVSGVSFDVEAKDTNCTDIVDWVAIGTRCDAGVAYYKTEENK